MLEEPNYLLQNKMDELRKKLQSIEWDMREGTFNKDKIPYYKNLLQEYKEMKGKAEKNVME